MAIEKKELDYAKEAGDVMNLVVEVVKHFKAKKSLGEAAELMDELMAAVSGIDQLDDEWKENRMAVVNAVYCGASELVDVFASKEEEAPAPAPEA